MRSRIDTIVARIAAAQEGCVEYGQLLKAGIPRGTIDHRIECGFLIRRHRGVFVVAHEGPIRHQDERAGMLAEGTGSFLVRRSCAHGHHLLKAPPVKPEISRLGRRRSQRPGIRFFSGLTIDSRDITEFGGFLMTTIPRMLLDLAGEGEMDLVAQLMNEARAKRLLRDGEVERLLARSRGTRGRPALAELIGKREHRGFTRSKAERLLRGLLDRAGLPHPSVNVGVAGRERDLTYERERLILEVDGYATHRTRAAFEDDRDRDAEMLATGWATLRITWWQLQNRPGVVVARIAAALAIRRAMLEAGPLGTGLAPMPS